MIFTERTITVVNDSATINKPLILYRGDKNIELKITIAESQFKFRNTDASNVIETTDASYAQLVINTPYNSPIFSDVAATKNGAVIFVITEAMIDEIREVGAYEIQIRLLDDNKQSRASIPPVSNAIEIREPIAIEDGSAVDSNAVNTARVNRALTTTSAPLEAFDSQGNYIKKTWGDGVLITDAALNKMEAGIDEVNKKVANVSSQIKDIENYSLVKHTDGKVYIKKQDGTLVGTGVEVGGNTDLSKVTMSMDGQTLKLLNDGTQIATVEIPTATVTDEQLTAIIQSKIDDGTFTSLALGDNSVSTANLQDKSITPNKTSFLREDYVNLVYGMNWTDIGWGECDDGKNMGYNTTYSELIPVTVDKLYIKSMPMSSRSSITGYRILVGCYDANKNFISLQNPNSIRDETVTVSDTEKYYIWTQETSLVENTAYVKIGASNSHTYSKENYSKMDGLIVQTTPITESTTASDTSLSVTELYSSKLFNAIVTDNSITNAKFGELILPDKTAFFIEKPVNLLDSSKAQKGKFFNSADTDTIAGFDATNVTDYIEVEYGKTYYSYNADPDYYANFSKIVVRGYDVNKNYLGVCYGALNSNLTTSDDGITSFTVDREDLKYIRFQYRNKYAHMLSEYPDMTVYPYDNCKLLTPTDKYKTFYFRQIFEDELTETNMTNLINKLSPVLNIRPLCAKKWVQIGDSLTDWGGGAHCSTTELYPEKVMDSATDGFMKYVRDKEGILYYNQGFAGAQWQLTKIDGSVNDNDGNPITSEPSSDQYSAVRRVDTLIANKDTFTPDIITILMGTNCADEGETTDTSDNLYTMCGAIRYCLENLLREFPTTPIGILLPPQRLEGNGWQEPRNEKIREIAQYYSIPVLDLFHEGQIVSANRVIVDGKPTSGNGSLNDGTHLGDTGKINLGRKLCNWLKTL